MRYAHKVIPTLGVKALDDAQGLVEAYCSVFNNVDYAGEIIEPGAFADTINAARVGEKDLPSVLWSHDMWSLPVGTTTEAEEVLPYDARLPEKIRTLGGLRTIGQFVMDTQMGHDTFAAIKAGALRKYSIGYYVLVEEFDRELGVVRLKKLDWLEWSPVNFAANDATLTVGAKAGMKGGLITTTEHVFYVHQPQDFVEGSYKREERETKSGKRYHVVTGKLRATGDVVEASVRFDADAWSAQDARSFSHSNGKGTFEAATKDVHTETRDEGTERLADNGARVVATVSDYVSRLEAVKDARIREGKVGRELSETNRTILSGLLPDLKSVMDRIQALLDKSEPVKSAEEAATKETATQLAAKLFELQVWSMSEGVELEEVAS